MRAYTKERAEIDGQTVYLTRNGNGRLIGIDIHYGLTDGHIGVHEPDFRSDWFYEKYRDLSDEVPLWLLEVLNLHTDMTDRSSEDGCSCEDPESPGAYDKHLGAEIWKQIQIRFKGAK